MYFKEVGEDGRPLFCGGNVWDRQAFRCLMPSQGELSSCCRCSVQKLGGGVQNLDTVLNKVLA